jgi:DNA polymerase-3 subunit epsilon
MAFEGYAVVDFETTGFSPAHHHRIIEIAIVHVDPLGNIGGKWETVLNPMRDLGPTHVHGLRGADVKSAPMFEHVASQFLGLLANRVLVAHNAAFEARFLNAELARMGAFSPLQEGDALCTMRLASDFLPGSGRSLADCCAAYDIELVNAHEALADAEATAYLLSAYLHQDAAYRAWTQHKALAETRQWPSLEATNTQWVSRRREALIERSFLHDTMAVLPASGDDTDSQTRGYLAQLDQALADGFLSVGEADSLRDLATDSGIGERRRARLHSTYFEDLAKAAWADNVLSDFEEAQLRLVGQLLDIPASSVADALSGQSHAAAAHVQVSTADIAPGRETNIGGAEGSTGHQLKAGDLIVLTGEMAEPREFYEELLRRRGLVPWASVTKKVKMLVADDPDSLSGKARKARAYGTPIITVNELIRLLEGLEG